MTNREEREATSGEEDIYESRTISGVRWGCLYLFLGVSVISAILFLLLMLWDRVVG